VATSVSPKWHHSNVYSAASACQHCDGVIRHEKWCCVINSVVRYAQGAAFRAECLTADDELRLHALGVCWIRSE